MAPLYGPDGELIGTMSLDRPRDGRVPPPWANEFLELFAEQAVIAILNARRAGATKRQTPLPEATT